MGEYRWISVDDLLPPYVILRTRKELIDPMLQESIRKHGILQPIVVTPEGDKYRIVAGYRRFYNAREAGLEKVPCIVIEKLSREKAILLSIIENIQRKDLNVMLLAEAVHKLHEEGLDVAEIAELLSRSDRYVYMLLSFMKLPEPVRNFARDRNWEFERLRILAQNADIVNEPEYYDVRKLMWYETLPAKALADYFKTIRSVREQLRQTKPAPPPKPQTQKPKEPPKEVRQESTQEGKQDVTNLPPAPQRVEKTLPE
ncbi:MAG: hypothetical protein DRP01_09355, partial [Archaeoglobales archaeon]